MLITLLDVLRVVIAPLVFLSAATVALVRVSGRPFGLCLPLTLTGSVLVLYISQLASSNFILGGVLLALIAASGVVLLFVQYSDLRERFWPGLAAFVALYLFFEVVDHGRRFWDIDEFWHWGMMVKETLRLGRFYSDPGSHLIIHKDYPPFLALFESLWCWLSGGYTEGRVTCALHVWEFSLVVLPLTELMLSHRSEASSAPGVRIRSSLLISRIVLQGCAALLVTGALFFVCQLFDHAFTIGTILADVPVALTFAYCMFLIVEGSCHQSPFDMVSLALGLVALVMSKQVGLAMFGVVLLAHLLFTISRCARDEAVPAVVSLSASVLVPLATKLSWSWVVRANNVSDIRSVAGGNGQFDLGKVNVSQFFAALTGKASDSLLNETFAHLMHAFVSDDVANLPNVPISFLASVVLVVLGVAIVVLLAHGRLSATDGVRLASSFTLGSVGFAVMLSVLFLFCFTPDEMQELRGYARYVDSYLIGEVVLLSMLTLLHGSWRLYDLIGAWGLLAPVLAMLCLSAVVNPSVFAALEPRRTAFDYVLPVEPVAMQLEEEASEGSSVGVLYDKAAGFGDSWFFRALLQYYANGVSVDNPFDLSPYDAASSEESIQLVLDYAAAHEYLVVTDDAALDSHVPHADAFGLGDGVIYRVKDGTYERCDGRDN